MKCAALFLALTMAAGMEMAACGNTMKSQNVALSDLLPGFVAATRAAWCASLNCSRRGISICGPDKQALSFVMPGTSRGIDVFAAGFREDVDGWDKPGHDGGSGDGHKKALETAVIVKDRNRSGQRYPLNIP
jgi:hypothetical protein